MKLVRQKLGYHYWMLALLFNINTSCENSTESIAQESKLELEEKQLEDNELSKAALLIVSKDVKYDPAYFSMSYPGGDVPEDKGVCTDVVIRAYRKLEIDLQKEVHEDMKNNFALYPKIWGLKSTDTNIDHRRVPNLMVFFARKGTERGITRDGEDYKSGDIVTWVLKGGLLHIGIVVNKRSADGKRYLIVHNIGNGQEISDCLFAYQITGHYTYLPKKL